MDNIKEVRVILSTNNLDTIFESNSLKSISNEYPKCFLMVEKFQAIVDPADIPASTHLFLVIDQALNATYSNVFSKSSNTFIPSRIVDSFVPTSFHYDNANTIIKYIYDYNSKHDNPIEISNNILDSIFSFKLASHDFAASTSELVNTNFSFILILKFRFMK
jgi:hypothetical protein